MTRLFAAGNNKAGKLTREAVADIRVKYHQEMWSQGRLAREFKVTVGTIGRIVRGETWQNLSHPPSNRAAYQEATIPLLPGQVDREAKESEARLLRSLGIEPVAAPPTSSRSESWDEGGALAASEPEQSSGLDRFHAEIEKIAPGAEERAEAKLKDFLGEG